MSVRSWDITRAEGGHEVKEGTVFEVDSETFRWVVLSATGDIEGHANSRHDAFMEAVRTIERMNMRKWIEDGVNGKDLKDDQHRVYGRVVPSLEPEKGAFKWTAYLKTRFAQGFAATEEEAMTSVAKELDE